ncbi:hypothetical protein GW17_00003569 [Ensete ventricosum]|nr:hypothetical protein GW17_00003569 [Ensete ventricosum]
MMVRVFQETNRGKVPRKFQLLQDKEDDRQLAIKFKEESKLNLTSPSSSSALAIALAFAASVASVDGALLPLPALSSEEWRGALTHLYSTGKYVVRLRSERSSHSWSMWRASNRSAPFPASYRPLDVCHVFESSIKSGTRSRDKFHGLVWGLPREHAAFPLFWR